MNRMDLLKEYLAKTPDDSFLRHAMALEYLKLNKEAEAVKLFEAILEDDPGYVGSYYHLGRALERTGDGKHALEVYRKGMEAAKKKGDGHAYRELQQALDDLM